MSTTGGRRLAPVRSVQLEIVAYARIVGLPAARRAIAAFNNDLKRCVPRVRLLLQVFQNLQPVLHIRKSLHKRCQPISLRCTFPATGSGELKLAAAVEAGLPNRSAKATFRPRIPANPRPSWLERLASL